MVYHSISDRTSGKNVAAILSDIVNGSAALDYSERRPVIDALMQDLKEDGVYKNWTERERVVALQALKTLGRQTEGCESIFTEEGIRTLMYHSGLNKATETFVDKSGSKEALKCLANVLLLKPITKPIFERLEGHVQCCQLLKRPHLSNESQFLFNRILFLVTFDAITIVKSLIDDHNAVSNIGVVLKTQLARTPDGTMFTQTMVLSEALKFLFNLMMMDPKIDRGGNILSDEEKNIETGKRFQSLLPTIVSILTAIPHSPSNPLSPPHSHAIHVLLNFPISVSALLVTRSQQALLLSVLIQMLDDTLKYLLNTDEETDGLSNGADLDEIVPPLVLVLTNIASSGGEGKVALKARLLPDDVDRSQPLEKGNSFSARLIRRMTSIRFPQIRETISQLLYVICDENASTLTRHVGYGNAAGFLMNRNLGMPTSMQSGGSNSASRESDDESHSPQVEDIDDLEASSTPPATSSSRKVSSETETNKKGTTTTTTAAPKPRPTLDANRRFSSTSTKSPSAASPPVNPITGAYYPDLASIRTAMADMTEEEKEEEAGRLLDMFDKLRRNGVMQVQNPALEAGLRQRELDRYYEEEERREQEEDEELERTYGKI
ncbi:hypothetical protein EMPS_10514 [Entomortierella parvispora]|uniref:Uncharacterized protein n=1 Tax=Entomortierella parvispora TaxID=205924 RepID=A0A9P3HKB6_9FUNG|nr:hypothetical protein EMPS_10514 [Entomortierella parvispora]